MTKIAHSVLAGSLFLGFFSINGFSDNGKSFEIIFPIEKFRKISCPFGFLIHPRTKKKVFHNGINIPAPEGTPIKACADGIVKVSADLGKTGYGKYILIQHKGGFSSLYGKLSILVVRKGQNVKQGDIIGKVGRTGRKSGPYLYFEIRKRRKPVNPAWLFQIKQKASIKKNIQDCSGEQNERNFIVPVKGKLSIGFGRIRGRRGRYYFHNGIDIFAPRGTPVRACADGIVKMSKNRGRRGYGQFIVIQHMNGLSSLYGHLSRRLARKGQRVKQGDIIGRVGTTGRVTGPHLHFEVRKGNKRLNPENFIKTTIAK